MASTHEHTAIWSNTGICIVDVIDAAVVEHARGVALVYAVVGEVDGIGIHNPGNAGRMSGLA